MLKFGRFELNATSAASSIWVVEYLTEVRQSSALYVEHYMRPN